MNNNDYERQYRQFRRRRRRHAIKAMLTPGTSNESCYDYGFVLCKFIWLKAFICLVLNKIKPLTHNEETCVVLIFDQYFDIDHYEWTSVFVSPKWFKHWYVSIENDGE